MFSPFEAYGGSLPPHIVSDALIVGLVLLAGLVPPHVLLSALLEVAAIVEVNLQTELLVLPFQAVPVVSLDVFVYLRVLCVFGTRESRDRRSEILEAGIYLPSRPVLVELGTLVSLEVLSSLVLALHAFMKELLLPLLEGA